MKKFLLLAILFLQTSCVTKALWGDKQYQERISQFLVGADGRYVVFVGEQYHYIFTDNSGVLRVLLSLGKEVVKINAKKTYLKLKSNNDLSGELVLNGSASLLTPQDLQALRAVGVYPDRDNELFIRIDASGRRYAAKYLNQPSSQTASSQVVAIHYSDSGVIKNAGKVAVTPIAVGVDAVLLIGKVVVNVFRL